MYVIEIERTKVGGKKATVIRLLFDRLPKAGNQTDILAEKIWSGDPPGIRLTEDSAYLRLEETSP